MNIFPDISESEVIDKYMADQTESDNKKEQKRELFRNQKQLLSTFLEHGAISRAQYDKSLGDLIVKMGITEEECRPE